MVSFPFPIPAASPFPVSKIPFGIFSTRNNVRNLMFLDMAFFLFENCAA
jgi:hypothetical protein